MIFFLGFPGSSSSQEEVSAPDYSAELAYSDSGDNQSEFELIRGRIISIDDEKNEIVIDQDQTHDKRTISVSAERLAYFKITDHVKVLVKPGENKAEYIHKVETWHPHPTLPK